MTTAHAWSALSRRYELTGIVPGGHLPHPGHPGVDPRRTLTHELGWRRFLAEVPEHRTHESEVCDRRSTAEKERALYKDRFESIEGGHRRAFDAAARRVPQVFQTA